MPDVIKSTGSGIGPTCKIVDVLSASQNVSTEYIPCNSLSIFPSNIPEKSGRCALALVRDATALNLQEQKLISRVLLALAIECDVVVLNFLELHCPVTNATLVFDQKSMAMSRGIVNLPTGTLRWWETNLRGAGLVPGVFENRKSDGCFLWSRPTTTRNGGKHMLKCLNQNKDVDLVEALHLRKEVVFPNILGKHNLSFLASEIKSCAVVFNAGLVGAVINPLLGSIIDAHHAVFRLNDAYMDAELSFYVGKKTSFRISHAKIGFAEKVINVTQNETLLFNIYGSQRESLQAAIRKSSVKHTKVFEIPSLVRVFGKKCLDQKEASVSTGLIAVLTAFQMCEKVVIFGKSSSFSSTDMHLFEPHYFDRVERNVELYRNAPYHNFTLEDKFFKQLSDSGLITLVP